MRSERTDTSVVAASGASRHAGPAMLYWRPRKPRAEPRLTDASDLNEAGRALAVAPPEDEFRALVQARMETLAKLGPAAGSSRSRLDLYAEALELGLARLKEA